MHTESNIMQEKVTINKSAFLFSLEGTQDIKCLSIGAIVALKPAPSLLIADEEDKEEFNTCV